ncbi:MAG TPA: CDP-diacylglycerol--serine O-phosphatidyltransferase [Bryobacteraceae bacterium]|nr:CDP-diacylglycerol--serine O-phosphatidyltransferase [Bryobacteraceae bacterium]
MPDLTPDLTEEVPKKRPPRAAYALPTLFTAGNIFLGFLSIIRSIHGTLSFASNPDYAAQSFEVAAMAIGWAVLLDGLDGRIARMTNTTSDFGRELDSLADVISFGIAPAILAYTWGVQFVGGVEFAVGPLLSVSIDQLQRAGKFVAFLFLVCGAARLARFNVQKNPQPRNPGRPNRKYFVGLPIPAAAALVAAVIYALGSHPITEFLPAIVWMLLLAMLSFLMISTWRYWSAKELNLLRPRSPILLVGMGIVLFAVLNWSKPVLLIITASYAASGVLVRIGGLIRRYTRPAPHPPRPQESQVG